MFSDGIFCNQLITNLLQKYLP